MDYFNKHNKIVLKSNTGTCGRGVYKIEDVNQINETLDKLFKNNFSISMCPFYDIEDEYGDHSHYREMLKVVMKLGYTGSKLNFEPLPQNRIDCLFYLLRKATNAPAQCINKFLHRTRAGSQYANNQQDK